MRVKRGQIKQKRRRNLLRDVKGYWYGRSRKERQAREAYVHAGNHAFNHRRDKKKDFRRLWNVRINAAARPLGYSFSTLTRALRTSNIGLNRKMLAKLASEKPESFERVVKKAVDKK